MPTSSHRRDAIGVAALCAVALFVLGARVSHAPPSVFDRAAAALLAHGALTGVAWIFTASCLWFTLVPIAFAAIALAIAAPAWRLRAVTSVALTLAAWRTSDALKDAFMRPRPAHWTFVHETSFSYPSGHAMFAVVVYGLWAWFVSHSALPAPFRRIVTPLLAVWACGILWSRLALGAHYPTDLVGGVLFGSACVAIAFAIVPQIENIPRRLAPRQ